MAFDIKQYSIDLKDKCVSAAGNGVQNVRGGIDRKLILPFYRKTILFFSGKYEDKIAHHNLMSEWKERKLDDFRVWLSALPEDGDFNSQEQGQDTCDLFTVLSEMTSLRKMVHDQAGNQQKSIEALDSFSEFCRVSSDYFKKRDKNIQEFQAEVSRDARKNTVLPFLGLRDKLEKGLEEAKAAALPKGLFKKNNKDAEQLVTRLEETLRKFDAALEAVGVRMVDTRGCDFDSSVMKSIAEESVEDTEPGKVLREVSAGFMLADNVLRRAEVVVSKEQ